ncbi:MAG: amidohydrolase family protein, partial [Cobetia amphilecti]
HPEMPVVINHAGVPGDRHPDTLRQWSRALAKVAAWPQVMIKFSGLGIAGQPWRLEDNREVFAIVLRHFGVHRVMFASNFPVSGLKVSYGDWLALVTSAIEQMTSADLRQCTLDKVLHDNAIHWYRLPIDAIASPTDTAAVTSSTAPSTTPSTTPSTATHTTPTA